MGAASESSPSSHELMAGVLVPSIEAVDTTVDILPPDVTCGIWSESRSASASLAAMSTSAEVVLSVTERALDKI